MASSTLRLVRVPYPYDLLRYLDGRQYDERVTYGTWVNQSKKYPYSSKRQTAGGRTAGGRNNIFDKLKARGLIREIFE